MQPSLYDAQKNVHLLRPCAEAHKAWTSIAGWATPSNALEEVLKDYVKQSTTGFQW